MLLDYRKDIDGLRAIAVMLVVLFHAGFAIPGGFIGVDIFFVISGFLITSLIQKQILRGKFTFKGFYLHRMRRILPALLFVILVTLCVNWFILMPDDFSFFMRSAFYSFISLSNIFFLKHNQDYFANSTETLQLLHTWSLSVEEQFYIIIPIFLIVLFKYFYKTKWFNFILSFVLFITFVISQYLAVKYSDFAYFGLPARFFELFIGVWLALNYNKLPVSKNRLFNNLLSLFAGLLIMLPAFYLTKGSIFPGFNALFVCLGSAILIYLGKTEEKTFITKFLSIRPMVFIGLISYSLYLWHWPVFSTFKIVGLTFNGINMLGVIAILIAISIFSWKFVEQTFRYKVRFNFLVTLIILFIVPTTSIYLLKNHSHLNNSFNNLRLSKESMNIVNSHTIKPFKVKQLCHIRSNYNKGEQDICYIGKLDENNVNIMFYGDSHANSMGGFMDVMLKDAGLKSFIFSISGLLTLKDTPIDIEIKAKQSRVKNPDQFVKNVMGEVYDRIENYNYKYIIIAGYYEKFQNSYGVERFNEIFINHIDYLISNNQIPIIIKDVPKIPITLVSCGIYNNLFNLNRDCGFDKDIAYETLNNMQAVYKELEEKYPQIIFIDPKDILCDEDKCYSSQNNIPYYFEDDHLSYSGSIYLAKQYLEKYGNPFEKLVK